MISRRDNSSCSDNTKGLFASESGFDWLIFFVWSQEQVAEQYTRGAKQNIMGQVRGTSLFNSNQFD